MNDQLAALDLVLAQTPVGEISEVVSRLGAIAGALDPRDGIACFNSLYARVTDAVAVQEGSAPASTSFLSTLDVVFANHYFEALRIWRSGGGNPVRAWAPLFAAHDRTDIHPLQFALAGMNAHINRDLPVALTEAFARLGRPMTHVGPERDAYDSVNELIAQIEAKAKTDYFGPLAATLDRDFDGVDDIVANWGIREARAAAWVNGEAMWAVRGSPALRADYLSALDGFVGFAGRGLLVPTAV
jgi:hypothetical protein